MSLLEAAGRVFSSFNNQMWRFIYAKRITEQWTQLLDLLYEDNQLAARDITALVVAVSRKTSEYDGRHHITHQFDAHAVWENFALEGSIQGIVTHSMKGFDYEKARRQLAIPFIRNVVTAIIAIGRRRPREKLPARLQGREFAGGIKPLLEVVMAVGSLKE